VRYKLIAKRGNPCDAAVIAAAGNKLAVALKQRTKARDNSTVLLNDCLVEQVMMRCEKKQRCDIVVPPYAAMDTGTIKPLAAL
jgi:hypothetical protein